MNIIDLIPNFIIENQQFECDEQLDREEKIGWLKTIDGFANAKGGIFYLGVKDKSYDLIGYDETDLDKEKLFLFNEVSRHFPLLPFIKTTPIPYEVNGKKRYILKAEVAESKQKPVILKYKEMPMVFLRRDGFTNAATNEELYAMINSSHPSFDIQTSDTEFDEKDFTKLAKFYEERNPSKSLTKKELASIGFFDDSGKLRQGAILFKDDYAGDKTKIVCSSYRGLTRGDDMIIASNSFQGNLIDSYHFAYEFVMQRSNHGFVKTPSGRIDIDAYSERALFEAIINALAHRDYLMEGSQISVDLFLNRLVISSPGSLFNAGELKATYNIDSIISRRRNELICDTFVLCKAMEAKGTGLEKIKEAYKGQDMHHQPFVFSKNSQFSIVLPDLTYEEGVRMAQESITPLKPISNPSRFDLDILSYCYGEPRSVKEIATYLGLSDSSFLRKQILGNLVSQDFLVELDKGGKKYSSNTQLISVR